MRQVCEGAEVVTIRIIFLDRAVEAKVRNIEAHGLALARAARFVKIGSFLCAQNPIEQFYFIDATLVGFAGVAKASDFHRNRAGSDGPAIGRSFVSGIQYAIPVDVNSRTRWLATIVSRNYVMPFADDGDRASP